MKLKWTPHEVCRTRSLIEDGSLEVNVTGKVTWTTGSIWEHGWPFITLGSLQ